MLFSRFLICNKMLQLLACLFLCCAAIFPNSYGLIDLSNSRKWVCLVFLLCLYCLFLLFLNAFVKLDIDIKIFWNALIITIFILLFYSVVLCFIDRTSMFVGSFDNSVGLSLCFALAFSVLAYSVFAKNKYLYYCMGITLVIGIILANSRTGIICIVCQLLISKSNFVGRHRVLIATGCVLILILLWHIKCASSLGRFFILIVAMQMIERHPILGWGIGVFDSHYMSFQALYFKNNPESQFAMLAGNTHHPLNEFVAIAVDYGLPAMLVVVILCIYVIWKNYKDGNLILVRVMVCIIIFSLLSYSLCFPITILCLLVVIYETFKEKFNVIKYKNYLQTGCFLLSVWGLQKVYNFDKIYTQWSKVATNCVYVVRKSDLLCYEMLTVTKELRNNPRFMYNYAVTLYDKGEYAKARKLIDSCLSIYSDYDLELLAGDIYGAQNIDEASVKHYAKAHDMCPARIMPFFSMYKLYEKRNRLTDMLEIRNQMKTKKLKVKSTEVVNMLKEMQVK